jgi:hypothetical protein
MRTATWLRGARIAWGAPALLEVPSFRAFLGSGAGGPAPGWDGVAPAENAGAGAGAAPRSRSEEGHGPGSDRIDLTELRDLLDGADVALRVLARLPGRRWRTTCLFRSLVALQAIREAGGSGRLVLGVRADPSRTCGRLVEAHAWVDAPELPPALRCRLPASGTGKFVLLGPRGRS